MTTEQRGIINKVREIRNDGKTRIENGSILRKLNRDLAEIENQKRFVGHPSSYVEALNELKKISNFDRLPYYLQQEYAVNIRNYVISLLGTNEGSREINAYAQRLGKNPRTQKDYEQIAAEYVVNKLKSVVEDTISKARSCGGENIQALINQGAGGGLLDLEGFQNEINRENIYLPYEISSKHGYRQYYWNGRLVKEIHIGIDYANKDHEGSMLQSPVSGRVVGVVDQGNGGYGVYVDIAPEGNAPLIFRHGHIKRGSVTVRAGDTVTKGITTFAEMGNTASAAPGQTTNKHVHLEARYTILGENRPICLDPIQLSADVARFNGNYNAYFASPLFKTRLQDLRESYKAAKRKNGSVGFADAQIYLIGEALKRL